MDNLSQALDESLLRDLECPVCMEYMVPPIKLCINGHNICSKCRGNVQSCPTCRSQFSDIRNVALENIARRQKYPCTNRNSGCKDFFSIDLIAEHQDFCTYGQIKCPVNKVYVHCPWKGVKGDLKEHAKTEHSELFLDTSSVLSNAIEDGIVRLVSCFNEVFLYYKRICDGKFYCAIQLVGASSQASRYICKFKLLAANDVEHITKVLFVPSYLEGMETTFSSGHCFRLDEVIIRNFAVEGKLKLTLHISTV